MSNTKPRLQKRNPSSEVRKDRSKNIYQLDNFQRKADECELNYHNLDFDFETLLDYAYLLSTYAKINTKFTEKDNLITAVMELEEVIKDDGDFIDASNFAFGSNHIIIEEACHIFYGSIYSFNLSFVNWDIPRDIKIGLSKVFMKLFPFFGSEKMRGKFTNRLKPMYDVQKDNFCEDLKHGENSAAAEEFEKSYKDFLVYGKKTVSKIEKLAKIRSGNGWYSDPELRQVNEGINFILSKDISQLNNLRSDRAYRQYGGEFIPVDCTLVFTIHDHSEIMDTFMSNLVTQVVEEANEYGGEMTYGRHKIFKDRKESIDDELVNTFISYEKHLTKIVGFLTNRYNYE